MILSDIAAPEDATTAPEVAPAGQNPMAIALLAARVGGGFPLALNWEHDY
jgi:hypothetical protein